MASSAKQDSTNNYRQYDFYDVYNLLAVEFYKRRGLSLADIRKVFVDFTSDQLQGVLTRKEQEIESEIKRQQRILQKLRETKAFCGTLEQYLNRFTIREFPLHEIVSEFTAISALQEYPDKVLGHIDLQEEDLMSGMVRALTFDRDGYLNTTIYLARKARGKRQKNAKYLESGKCLYTVVESGRVNNSDNHLIESTREAAIKWADKNGYHPSGIVYLKVRLFLFQGEKERVFVEAWAPV